MITRLTEDQVLVGTYSRGLASLTREELLDEIKSLHMENHSLLGREVIREVRRLDNELWKAKQENDSSVASAGAWKMSETKDFDKERKIMAKAKDSELIELHRNYAKYVGMANTAIRTNAKTFGYKAHQKEQAALAIQVYRERFLQLLEAELVKRGLSLV